MAVRTVSVELKMKISDFELAAAKAAATTKALGNEFDHLGKSSGSFSTAKPTKEMQNFSRVINGALKDGKTGFESIQSAIDDTKTHIANLRSQIRSGSGSDGIFGDLKQANKDLRTLQGIMKDIEPSAAKIGNSLGAAGAGSADLQFSLGRLGVAAAPFLLPVAAGSLLGVLAGAGVGLGILGQLKDPNVQAAVKSFRADVSGSLSSATSAFGPEIVKSLAIARSGVSTFIGDLKPAFDALAPETERIATDFVHGLEQAGPALSRSLIAAKPDLEALSRLVGSLPSDAASFFSGLSIGASGGARAIDDLDTQVKQLSGDLGTALGSIGAVYGGIAKLSDAAHANAQHSFVLGSIWQGAADSLNQLFNPVKFVSDKINALKKAFGGSSTAAQSFDGSVQVLTGNLGPFKAETYGVAAAEDALYKSLSSVFDISMSLDKANLGAAQGLADLKTAIKTNGRAWDENTQAGRNNMGQLLNSIDADKRAYDAQVASQGATAGATKKYDDQVNKLLDLARKAGLSRSEIAKLKSEYESIPPSKTFTLRVVTSGNINQAMAIARASGQRVASRWGNLFEPAADGLLSQARTYTPVSPGRFMIAEPQTGGEAFIPKFGDYGRSMSILSAAAGWYGAHVVAGGGGSSAGAAPVVVNLYASDPGGAALIGAIRLGVQDRGGDPVKVLTPR